MLSKKLRSNKLSRIATALLTIKFVFRRTEEWITKNRKIRELIWTFKKISARYRRTLRRRKPTLEKRLFQTIKLSSNYFTVNVKDSFEQIAAGKIYGLLKKTATNFEIISKVLHFSQKVLFI